MRNRQISGLWQRSHRLLAPVMVLLAMAAIALGAGVSQLVSQSTRPVLASESRLKPTTPHARHFGNDPVMAELEDILDSEGIEAALKRLDVLSLTNLEVRERKHPYVHDLGWLAYEHSSDVAEAFRQCPASPDTGCHHGVVQAYLSWAPQFSRGDVKTFCDGGTIDVGALEILRFQCFHGLGHGLLMDSDYRLDEALASCDLLEMEQDRGSCYGGVFMEGIEENIFAWERSRQIVPDPVSLAEAPFAPCQRVAEQYRPACYIQLPMAILPANDYDFAASFAACEQAPAAFTVNCYLGMGGMATVVEFESPTRAQALCGLGAPPFRVWCSVGGAQTLISVHGRADEALLFCSASPPATAAFCFETIGESLYTVATDPAEQRRACQQAGQPEWILACLNAAGLQGAAAG